MSVIKSKMMIKIKRIEGAGCVSRLNLNRFLNPNLTPVPNCGGDGGVR